MPQKNSHHNFPISSLFYLALQYLSSSHPDTLKTWCPGPGAWFDAMDVDRTGDLDLDEAWPTPFPPTWFQPGTTCQVLGALVLASAFFSPETAAENRYWMTSSIYTLMK